ncbi:LAFA_0C02938g1_1 [Lachancea sp. 'fantastica']|nr:LAFA_0C02938g1_1 [Lachancea sp. 'fantastica']
MSPHVKLPSIQTLIASLDHQQDNANINTSSGQQQQQLQQHHHQQQMQTQMQFPQHNIGSRDNGVLTRPVPALRLYVPTPPASAAPSAVPSAAPSVPSSASSSYSAGSSSSSSLFSSVASAPSPASSPVPASAPAPVSAPVPVSAPSGTTPRRSNLPKKTVEILNQWLLTHLNYPYPSPQEKRELLLKTGLSKVQLSNWFINVRRRKVFSDYYLMSRSSSSSETDASSIANTGSTTTTSKAFPTTTTTTVAATLAAPVPKEAGSSLPSEVTDKRVNAAIPPLTRRKKLIDRLEELKRASAQP